MKQLLEMIKLGKGWMQIVSVLLFLVLFLLLIPTIYAEKNTRNYEIESSNIRLTVTSKGEINSIFDRKNKKMIPFIGETFFEGCSAEVLSI